jgi:hypothetical protein
VIPSRGTPCPHVFPTARRLPFPLHLPKSGPKRWRERTDVSHGLFPHQVANLAFLLGRRRAILADDMGLGKTRQAIIARTEAARAYSCPADDDGRPIREIIEINNREARQPSLTGTIVSPMHRRLQANIEVMREVALRSSPVPDRHLLQQVVGPENVLTQLFRGRETSRRYPTAKTSGRDAPGAASLSLRRTLPEDLAGRPEGPSGPAFAGRLHFAASRSCNSLLLLPFWGSESPSARSVRPLPLPESVRIQSRRERELSPTDDLRTGND